MTARLMTVNIHDSDYWTCHLLVSMVRRAYRGGSTERFGGQCPMPLVIFDVFIASDSSRTGNGRPFAAAENRLACLQVVTHASRALSE